MAGDNGTSLEYTPTWVVAVVCSVIVFISFALERTLHYLGKLLKRKNQKALFEALLKVKEELMLLGFISLLLTVFQGAIGHFCIPKHLTNRMLPCKKKTLAETGHYQSTFFFGVLGGMRRLLAEGSATDQCAKHGKVPLLSQKALHELHIFIFVLAIAHVFFCLITVILGGIKIHQWKRWEDSIGKDKYNTDQVPTSMFTNVRDHAFIRNRFRGVGKDSAILSWVYSFIKQFYGSVTKSDYITLRLGFIMTHCRGNPKFDFHKYMIRALEADFKRVVGISWYLWIFVVIFLLLNIYGWHAYFWMAFIPLILLLAVGTKLEHVISQLAHEVAEKHTAIEGDLVVMPSDDHFWFNRPRIVLHLIHFILFQNAFELAVFFWILTTYGFKSCLMGEVGYVIPRIVIGVIVQIVCSYSTLPLYAIVTQKAIFDEHVQQGLVGWAQKVKKRNKMRVANSQDSVGHNGSADGSSVGIQLKNLGHKESEIEEGVARKFDPSTVSNSHQATAP